MKRLELFLLIILLFGAFFVRLYRIDNPIADWHSWRQADTSAVSRNFVKDGIDILHPKFDDLSNVPSGFDNPQGYRFVEFPIFNATQAALYKLFPIFTLEVWGRLVSIFASILSITFLYLLVRKYINVPAAFFTAFFFAFLPFSIYYGRTILPDGAMVSAILGGIFFFDKWIEKKHWIFFLLSLTFTGEAFLLKPYALFFTLPIMYLAWKEFGFSFIKKWQLWIYLLLALLPLILWRTWITQFPEGIPVSDWLFNKGDIRFKGSFFYWVFADRIGRLILGYFGTALLVLGLIRKANQKEGLFFFTFLLSSLLYIFTIAAGNVQHDYYQILILPTLAIFLGKGADFLLHSPKDLFNKWVSFTMFGICILASIIFGWYHVRDYFNINNRSMIIAGQAVDRLTPKDAKIIAPLDGDTSFLYQTNRKGWASFEKSPEELREMGANFLVLTNPTKNDFDGFGKKFKIVESTKEYIIFDLAQSP